MTYPSGGPCDVLPMVYPFGLRVRGDVDRAGLSVLARWLAWTVRVGEADIHLDLSELAFIDVAGLRLIIATAADLPPPRRLVLRHTPPAVRNLLLLLGWQLSPEQCLCPAVIGADPQGPDPESSPPL